MTYLAATALDGKRQVLAVMETISTEKWLLSAVALANGARKKRITSLKLEAKIRKEGRIKSNITTAAVSGFYDDTAKDLIVESTLNFLPGDIIEIRTVDNKLRGNLTLWVDSIADATTLKVKKMGGEDIAIEDTDVAILKLKINKEHSGIDNRPIHLPTDMYNLTTIIRADRGITGTSTAIDNYDAKSSEAVARRQMLEEMADSLNSICTSGIRTAKVLNGNNVKAAGGLPFFCDNTFDANGEVTGVATLNVKDAAGADISQEMINDGFQYVIENGGRLNSALVSPAQARKISGFDENKVVINYDANNTVRGGAVQVLKSPIVINGNEIDKLYIDTSVAKDEVRLFDRAQFYLVPMEGRSYNETRTTFTDNGIDGIQLDALGEWSFLFPNADVYSYRIKNLAI